MYIGQIVHFFYRGRCNAAIIVQFWDDDDAVARLQTFEPGGTTQHGRARKGNPGEDITFHTLEECPDVDLGIPVSLTPVIDNDPTDGEPEATEPAPDSAGDATATEPATEPVTPPPPPTEPTAARGKAKGKSTAKTI